MVLAAEAALAHTASPRYRDVAEQAYAWYLGENDAGIPVAEPATGGCHDGLEHDGVNANMGAESTLMWLTTLEHMREIRRAAPVDSQVEVVGGG